MTATGTQEPQALAAIATFGRAFDARDVDAIMATMTADCVFVDTGPPDGHRHVGQAAVLRSYKTGQGIRSGTGGKLGLVAGSNAEGLSFIPAQGYVLANGLCGVDVSFKAVRRGWGVYWTEFIVRMVTSSTNRQSSSCGRRAARRGCRSAACSGRGCCRR